MNTFNLNIFLFMALCGSASLPVEKRALPISCGTGNIYMIFLLFLLLLLPLSCRLLFCYKRNASRRQQLFRVPCQLVDFSVAAQHTVRSRSELATASEPIRWPEFWSSGMNFLLPTNVTTRTDTNSSFIGHSSWRHFQFKKKKKKRREFFLWICD